MKKILITILIVSSLLIPSLSIKAVEVPQAQLTVIQSFTWTFQTRISNDILFRSNKVSISDIQVINITAGNNYGSHESVIFSTPVLRFFENYSDTDPALTINKFDLNTWHDITQFSYNWVQVDVTTVISSGQSETDARNAFLSQNQIGAVLITEGILISVEAVKEAYLQGLGDGQQQAYDEGYAVARDYYSAFIDGAWKTAQQMYELGYSAGEEAFNAWLAIFSIIPMMFASLFTIEIAPGVYTGYIAGLSIILGLISFYFAFKKGK